MIAGIAYQVCVNCGGHRMGAEPIECCPACNTPYENEEGKKETMDNEEKKKLEAGEIVRLKSGGPMMTIGTPSESSSSSCYWFDGVKLKSGAFPTTTLRRVDADEIEAERTVLFAEADKVKANAERSKVLFEHLNSSVIPMLSECIRERAAADVAKPSRLFNSLKGAFLALSAEGREAAVKSVFAHDPEAGEKFFEAMMATG